MRSLFAWLILASSLLAQYTPPTSAAATRCETYGASASASASANVTALNQCLASGGFVTLYTSGTYQINAPLVIGSNTHFALGPKTTIFLANTTNKNLLVNNGYNTFATTASVTLGTPTLLSVPITWTAHGLSVGQYVLLSGASPSNYNGVFKVATVTNANTFTVQLDRLPTNGLATATYVSGGSFSGTGTCALSSFNNGNVGGTASIAVSSGTPGAITILTTGYNSTAAATTATAASGTATCSGTVTLTSTLQEAIAYGTTVGKLCDQNIIVEGGIWDGNSANNATVGLATVQFVFSALDNLVVRNVVMQDSTYANIRVGALRDYVIDNVSIPWTFSEAVKVYGPAYNGRVTNIRGNMADDGVSFQTLEATAFAATAWTHGDIMMGVVDGVYFNRPTSGAGNATVLYVSPNEYMGGMKISNIGGTSPNATGGVAALITTTYANSALNDVEYDNIDTAMTNLVQVYGSSPGTLTVSSIAVHHLVLQPPNFAVPATATIYSDNTATIGKWDIDDAVLKSPNFTSAGGYFMIVGGTVNELNLTNWAMRAATNVTAIVNLNSTAVVAKLNVDRISQTIAGSNLIVVNSGATVGLISLTNSDVNTPVVIGALGSLSANITGNHFTNASFGVIRTTGTVTVTAELGGNTYTGGSVRLTVASGTPVLQLHDTDPVLGALDFGTVPTITGCGNISAQTGGTTAGTFTTDQTGTCAAAFALPTALHGWACFVNDITKHVATNIMIQSATSVSSCTVTGTTAASDVLTFTATPF